MAETLTPETLIDEVLLNLSETTVALSSLSPFLKLIPGGSDAEEYVEAGMEALGSARRNLLILRLLETSESAVEWEDTTKT